MTGRSHVVSFDATMSSRTDNSWTRCQHVFIVSLIRVPSLIVYGRFTQLIDTGVEKEAPKAYAIPSGVNGTSTN